MSHVFYLFAVSAALTATLAAISISAPRALWIKAGALAVAALFLPTTYISLTDLLSRPKPIALEWWHRDLSEAVVLGANLREGEAIYLWLKVAGLEAPRSYVLPWHQKLAEQLYGAQREADSTGTAVRVKTPFVAGRTDEDPMFYAVPHSPRPPKESPVDQPPMYVYRSSTRN